MAVESEITEKTYFPGAAMAPEALTGLVFLDPDELVVELTLDGETVATVLARDTHYTIDGDGYAGTAAITALAEYESGDLWRIYRSGEINQPEVLPRFGPLPAKDLERGLDRGMLRLAELKREIGRAVLSPRGEAALEWPALADRLGKYLGFDADGDFVLLGSGGADDELRDDLADVLAGAALVALKQAGSGTRTRSVASKLAELFLATDLSGVDADGSDATADLIAGLVAHLGATERKSVVIAGNLPWHPMQVLGNAGVKVKERLVILDLAGHNAARKAGENTKLLGVFSVDPDETEDTLWGHTSGHHPAFLLNNLGTSATTSAQQGFMSLLFARGYWTEGNEDDRGVRGAMFQQYRQSAGDADLWEFVIRSLAPWKAFKPGVRFERWTATTAVASGDYLLTNDGRIYEYTGGGTTGASAPTNEDVPVADGTATALYVDANDRLVFALNELGRIALNGGVSVTDLFSAKQSPLDPATTAVARISGTGESKSASLVLEATDADGDELPGYAMTAKPDGSWELRDGGGALVMSVEGPNKGMKFEKIRMANDAAANADTTPSVLNVGTLFVGNAGATSITALDDGQEGDLIEIIATTANTTLVHGAGFRLTGSTNIALTEGSVVTMRKCPSDKLGGAWVEVSRSIK